MSILEDVISPGAAVDKLCTAGVQVSERALRQKARRIGAYHEIGGAMFFTPDDLDRLIQPEAKQCSNQSKGRGRPSTLRGGQSTVGKSKGQRKPITTLLQKDAVSKSQQKSQAKVKPIKMLPIHLETR